MIFRLFWASAKTSHSFFFLKFWLEVRVHHHAVMVTLLKVVEDTSEDL